MCGGSTYIYSFNLDELIIICRLPMICVEPDATKEI